MSPATSRQSRQKHILPVVRSLLSANARFRLPLPFIKHSWYFSIDTRLLGESILLLTSLFYAVSNISQYHAPTISSTPRASTGDWLVYELHILECLSFSYLIWAHSSISEPKMLNSQQIRDHVSLPPSTSAIQRPASPRLFDTKDSRRNTAQISFSKNDFGYVWMSVPKNYRESRDDGIFTGLLLGPIIASAFLISSLRNESSSSSILPAGWLIELPLQLRSAGALFTSSEALVLSRYSLVNLSTFCSTILLIHVCASWWLEARFVKLTNKPEGERASVPRSEGRRSWYYITFILLVSLGMVGLKITFDRVGILLWEHLNYFESFVASTFYQFTLYIALRLAHRGFTLGELGLVCFGGTSLCLEFLNLTIAQMWPVTTAYIRTYRLPTPLLIFQIALIVGSFLTGFLLSPFLVLSRNNAQRPVHRVRSPEEKLRNRRYYAFGFYIGTLLIVGGLIGFWTRWCLGSRDPWLWAIFYIVEGNKPWSRLALLSYWALLGCISVAGWNRQLARSRKFRPRNPTTGEQTLVTQVYDVPSPTPASSEAVNTATLVTPSPPPSAGIGMSFPNLPNLQIPSLPNGSNVSNVATDLMDAADKHVPTLGLNARRKFFHGLAIVMFIPGIAFDPAFTHLSFSAAFALFTFTEYVRYFAIYPFGASVHLFMNAFLDHRDSGTAILSHFYLLTGCAGSLWLEGPSKLLQFTGILTLGVGDAAASIIGRRIGTYKWSPTTNKTVEGSLAFVVSIFGSAWFLRLCGLAELFPSLWYLFAAVASGLLEALSDQNDNLTLPLYMWSMLVLVGV